MDGDSGMDSMMNAVQNENVKARMEGEGKDSGTSALKSMGYIDGEAEMGREKGDSMSSVTSALQTVIILSVVAFFVFGAVYVLVETVLSMFGV